MRIGYPCINRSIGCTANRTFRLGSYSGEKLAATVEENLACLERILSFNRAKRILFFRISSDIIPFASHPVMDHPWMEVFGERFRALGKLIRKSGMRISMHPDQFTLINSPGEPIFRRSGAELRYHAGILDLMDLGTAAKIQIHVGGVYGDRELAIDRFIVRSSQLDEAILRHLVIENDDRRFPLADCLRIYRETGLPVLLDTFHHELNNRGESLPEAIASASETWHPRDGVPMVDYSSQEPGKRAGSHAGKLDPGHFRRFLRATGDRNLDVMLEIKDKERSALLALGIAARREGRESGKRKRSFEDLHELSSAMKTGGRDEG